MKQNKFIGEVKGGEVAKDPDSRENNRTSPECSQLFIPSGGIN